MSSNIATATIRLTKNSDALAKLRRLGNTKKSGGLGGLHVDQYGERFDAMFDGNAIPFWIGEVKEIPLNWAEALVESYIMPLDGPCPHCSTKDTRAAGTGGAGYTIAGVCTTCKSTGWVDLNISASLFKIEDRADPLTLAPKNYQGPPKKIDAPVTTKKAAEALA